MKFASTRLKNEKKKKTEINACLSSFVTMRYFSERPLMEFARIMMFAYCSAVAGDVDFTSLP